MVYWRYGNPRCPWQFKGGDHPRIAMVRAYYRDPETRTFVPCGWFCEDCKKVWVDGEKELMDSLEHDPR